MHRPRLRRDQPGGHRRPALLRDRTPAAGPAGHPGVPRRPARHRDRRARRPDQRAAGGQEGAEGRPGRRQRGRRRRPGDHPTAAPPGLHRHHRLRPATARSARTTPTSTSTAGGSRTPPTPAARRAPWPRCSSAPTFSSGCPRRTCSPATTSPRWRTEAIVFALANPDPEVDPFAASKHAAIVATGRSDYPNQINNVLAFPGFFRGMLDSGAHEITDECLLAAATAIADCVEAERTQRELHRAVRVRPRRRAQPWPPRSAKPPPDQPDQPHQPTTPAPANQPASGRRKELKAVTTSEPRNPGTGPGDRRTDPAGAGRTADLR